MPQTPTFKMASTKFGQISPRLLDQEILMVTVLSMKMMKRFTSPFFKL